MPAPVLGPKIRHPLVGLAAAGVGLALAVAVFGHWTAGALGDALRRATAASSAAYNFMLGDMMHDALHADVLIALRIGPSGTPEAKGEAAADLGGHARTFRGALAALRATELDAELREAIAALERPIEAYISGAEEVAALAFADGAAAASRYADFFRVFEALEAANGRVGELIDARAAAIGLEGEGRTRMARAALVAFSLGTIVAVSTAAVAAVLGIARRDAREARERHLASHDALTGLPNRALLRERVQGALSRGRRTGEATAVLCVDLDRFKEVNDLHGHAAGDRLLVEVAARLTRCAGEAGAAAARLGGDEFAVVQIGVDQPAAAGALARKILDALGEPFELGGGHRVAGGASIGVALASADGDAADDLLRNADIALHRAKADGRGACRLFEVGMDAPLRARWRLEEELRQALAEERFTLHYQPQVDAEGGRAMGFEALVRLQDAEGGMVPPAEFIPLAEETGLILPLGAWVLRRACAEAAAWPAPLRVAVNLSPVQFRQADLVGLVAGTLREAGLEPERLELEITEGVLLHNTEATLATLAGLKGLGVRISMDDFGMGYSSLGYLRKFPFDKIKIDRSFVRVLGDGRPGDVAVVRAIVALGHGLGMTTTAEGVETADQAARLRAEGCDEMQGYLFSPPQPADVVGAMIAREGRARSPAPPAGEAGPARWSA